METYSQKQKFEALIAFTSLVHGYLVNNGKFDDAQQQKALTALVEGWEGLSLDGRWDSFVQEALETRGLFTPAPPPAKVKPISADDNDQFTTLSQPNASVCQATCICMAMGWGADRIMDVRRLLTQGGAIAGDPNVMAQYMSPLLGDRYKLDLTASMEQIEDWLNRGAFLITHGFLTGAGHVFGLDGYSIKGGKRKISVKDPFGEFSFPSWSYKSGVTKYDGDYSELGVYSAIMAWSVGEARELYSLGSVDRKKNAAYVHVIWPKK